MTFPCPIKVRFTRHRKRTLRVLAATMLTAVMAVPASAADWPDDSLRGSYSSSAPMRWDGFNFGGSLGLSNMNTDFGNSSSGLIAYSLRNTTVQSEYSPSSWTTLPTNTTNGRQYGVFLGYNVQWSELVLGFDAAYNRPTSLESSASDSIGRQVTTSDTFVNQVTISAQSQLKLIDYATARIRAGYAWGQFLPYAAVGVAVGRFNYSTTATTTVGGNSTTIVPPNNTYGPNTDVQSSSRNGAFTAGPLFALGLDVAITPNIFARAEWEYAAFAPLNGIRAGLNTGRVGLGVRF
ncbi:MAG TPA: outer membrane beta-barrel protein [Pseudolabrys sp.]|jgi:opacity protein-like surface antigen